MQHLLHLLLLLLVLSYQCQVGLLVMVVIMAAAVTVAVSMSVQQSNLAGDCCQHGNQCAAHVAAYQAITAVGGYVDSRELSWHKALQAQRSIRVL
jgi:hypothetical protein